MDYGNGWKLQCRFASSVLNESSGIQIGPTKTKCDLIFGNFTYSGQSGTRLGVTIAFVTAGGSISVQSNPKTAVKPCQSGGGICLVVGGSSTAAVFTWSQVTANTQGVTISALINYQGNQTDFVLPANGASSYVATQAPTLGSIDVTAFAAANTAVFSFANPESGDVWDPQLNQNSASTLDTQSSGSVFTYSFGLIIAALIAKYL